ncbi:hypothetical protein PFICI_00870 [Pestalotiopsis fici W106-1]|uniref:Uncharacterized protein n=1 Tax=Pestalotiopsis fici (strain W106-1 / CGMCC3.15140) TaxID=1229662 RepID=W3XNE7_PESFW|nr:uncharacterized protein PFICI_00870 [Pestalotiopsis fici W106-1]ETS87042.1 hypothetical protein PFICI_00870 [Pestalotiopsis fici W106-1]
MQSTAVHKNARLYVLIRPEQINRVLDSMNTSNSQPFFARLVHLPCPGLADVDEGDQKDAVDPPYAVVPSYQEMPPNRIMPDGEAERDDDNNDNESSNDADKKRRKYKDIDAEDDDANDNGSKH